MKTCTISFLAFALIGCVSSAENHGSFRTELCNENGSVRYRATQSKGVITIVAEGTHNTLGYKVRFEQSMLMIFPPQFVLKHDKPTGIVGQAITPFRAETQFRSAEPVASVIVRDARGPHMVKVTRSRN